jgi:hypothetical protein
MKWKLCLISLACLSAFAGSEREKRLEERGRPLEQRLAALGERLRFADEAARAPRVVKARGVAAGQVRHLIAQYTEGPDLGLLGDPHVNARIDHGERHPARK